MEIASKSTSIEDIFRRLLPDIADFEIDKKIVSKHDQIFQSFRYRKPVSNVGASTASNSKVTDMKTLKSETKQPAPDSDSKDDVVEFYLDKRPSTEDGPSESENVEVITVDLSNIAQSDNESGTEAHTERVLPEDSDPEDNGAEDSIQQYGQRKKHKKKTKKKDKGTLSSNLQTNMTEDDLYLNVDPYLQPGNIEMDKIKTGKQQEPEIMKKSVITSDFENQEAIETTHKSIRQLKKQRRLEREKTKGDKWFHMPATELTEERKNDYEVIQMRKALDPKRFYKANDFKVAPKYFQFGEVVESAADFYSSRVPKKQRKATVVEELLADAQFRQYNKRKYEEIQEAKKLGQGPYKHMKRMKKKKKK